MTRVLPSLGLFALAFYLQKFVAADPVIHVLFQFPVLILAGGFLGWGRPMPPDAVGPALVLAIVAGAIWMLPRSVDAALIEPSWRVAKFVTLPLCVGLPIGLAWPVLGFILRGFLKAQCISMLLFLAFLYTHAPVRLCNSYLESDQVRLGNGFAYVAIGLILLWVLPLFVGGLSPLKERPAL